jgi:RNA polymerase sigma factor (sigma-70 family)
MMPLRPSGSGHLDSEPEALFEEYLGLPLLQAIDLVYVVALRLTGNQHDAWDLAQDVCEKVLRLLNNGAMPRIEESSRAWLKQVTRTCFIAKWRWTRALKRGGGELDLPREEAASRAWRDEISEQIESNETARTVRSAVAELSPKQRAVIELVLRGYSLTEIATKLGIDVGTVKSRAHAARSRLRGELTPALVGEGRPT